ncbi:hypothetical protein ACFL37_00085 [Candidatus Margulisiibacteriota bacterium]
MSNLYQKIALIILITTFILGQAALASNDSPLDLPVKQLYSAPMADSNLILDIPIEVKLLDISPDGNWYKVKIAYNIGPFSYTYVGWSHIPVMDVIAERDKDTSDIAYLLEGN